MATSKARGGVIHGKQKGKRKAKEPPSPASSDSSNNTIGEAFVAREEAKRIKIKEEPTSERRRLSSQIPAAERVDAMGIDTPDEDTTFEKIEHGLFTPSSTHHTVGDRSPRDLSLNFDISADSLYVLGRCKIVSRKFRRRAEELIDDAFALPAQSEDDAPGLAYLEWVIEELNQSGATYERKEEVKQQLMKIWRSQMASYIGRNTFTSDEAQNAIDAFMNALPLQAKPDRTSLPLLADSQFEGNDVRSGGCSAVKAIDFEFTDKQVLEDVHSAGRDPNASILETTPEIASQNAVLAEPLGEPFELINEPAVEPVFIPNPVLTNVDFSRRVMFFVRAPDMPYINISEARMIRACSLAFGTGPASPQVERFSDHIWMATFQRAEDAERARGKAIVLNGRSIVAEYVHPKPPQAFSCDFTDIDVEDAEVALQVANAFNGRDKGVQLRIQNTKKLYPGRVFLMAVPKTQRVVRFYIPMRTQNSNETFMACFTPVNPKIPCSFCGDKHRRGEICAHSRIVPLPFEMRGRA